MDSALWDQLDQMQKVASTFYRGATCVSPQCHAFIEHAGLLNEFIKICTQTANRPHGDFNNANIHTGEPLLIHGHNVEYLAEKFACIYGPTLASNEAQLELFVRKFTGVSAEKFARLRGG